MSTFETFIFVCMYSVQQVSAGAVKQQLADERVSILETFDVKFTDPRSRKRMAIDVRIKFRQGRPIIVYTKKNEAKVVLFDVLSLHRYIHVHSNYPVCDTQRSCLYTVTSTWEVCIMYRAYNIVSFLVQGTHNLENFTVHKIFSTHLETMTYE